VDGQPTGDNDPALTSDGYSVRYADGYTSWSPKDVFEAAYRVAEGDEQRLNFGDALHYLKLGRKVARAGWNGKGMWLALTGGVHARRVPYQAFWSPHNANHALEQGGYATVLPSITMRTADGSILMGWLASQTDMLAEDWMVLP
jgi:hypothetical protein